MTRRLRPPTVTLRSFGLDEVLCFLSAWRPREPWDPPGMPRVGRWTTWAEFLGHYAAVRDELLVRFAHCVSLDSLETAPFAERAAQYARAYGLDALDAPGAYDRVQAFACEGSPSPQDSPVADGSPSQPSRSGRTRRAAGSPERSSP